MLLTRTSFLAARCDLRANGSMPPAQLLTSSAGATSQPRHGAEATLPLMSMSAIPRNCESRVNSQSCSQTSGSCSLYT